MVRVITVVVALALSLGAAAQEGFSPFTTDFPPDEFAARRARVYDAIGPTAIAVLQGAPSPVGYTRFRQTNELYYLSGIEVPHAYLLLDGASRTSAIYLPERNERREASEGKLLSADDAATVRQLSGLDAVHAVNLLGEHLARAARGTQPTLFTPMSPAEGAATSRDLALRAVADRAADPFDGAPSREGAFVRTLGERFPQFTIRDLSPTLDRLRLIKSPRELTLIRKATRLAGLALMEAMRSAEPGMYEHELDAMAKYVFFRNGAQGEAYYSLIASATNAFYPHYNAGKRQMRDGDFLLMDFAPDVGYYMSDITRMMPVNGRFSPWQRELYGFYLGCYRAILDNIRPGLTPRAVAQQAMPKLDALLAASSFSKPGYRRAAERLVAEYRQLAGDAHGSLGHWVGMATHDVGGHDGPLLPGMVFTIEPALVVPDEKIYVRLEDLVIVTEQGTDVPSLFVPLDIDAIEALMQEPGMLQRYPRDVPKS